MAKTITVQPNQSMLDVVLQACGSLEALVQFCLDNDVAVSDIPVPGSVMVVSDAALALGDKDALRLIARDKVMFGTLGVMPGDMLLNDDGTPLLNDDGRYMWA